MGWFLENQQIARDRILGGAQPGTTDSTLQTEANACLLGRRWVVQTSIPRVTILTDSTRFVEMLMTGDSIDMQIFCGLFLKFRSWVSPSTSVTSTRLIDNEYNRHMILL